MRSYKRCHKSDGHSANDRPRYATRRRTSACAALHVRISFFLVPPRIGPVPPLFVSTLLGGCVSFDCPTTGNPPPIVEWYRNGVAVSDSLSSTYPNGTLSICRLDDDDSGLYECRVTNSAGEDKIAIELDVQCKRTLHHEHAHFKFFIRPPQLGPCWVAA